MNLMSKKEGVVACICVITMVKVNLCGLCKSTSSPEIRMDHGGWGWRNHTCSSLLSVQRNVVCLVTWGSSGSGGKIIGRSVQNAGCPFWRGDTKHGHTGDLEVGWLRARWTFPPLQALSRSLCQTWKLTHVDAFGEMLEFVLQCEITCCLFLPVY